eukprot:GHVQ01013955.1.p1 GENE.GHVQ01013955.1~~GHVQ01013955.1.p1  ORF type:complete len:1489 (-),score=146.89 GHVQ01013955.1:2866-7332(-)
MNSRSCSAEDKHVPARRPDTAGSSDDVWLPGLKLEDTGYRYALGGILIYHDQCQSRHEDSKIDDGNANTYANQSGTGTSDAHDLSMLLEGHDRLSFPPHPPPSRSSRFFAPRKTEQRVLLVPKGCLLFSSNFESGNLKAVIFHPEGAAASPTKLNCENVESSNCPPLRSPTPPSANALQTSKIATYTLLLSTDGTSASNATQWFYFSASIPSRECSSGAAPVDGIRKLRTDYRVLDDAEQARFRIINFTKPDSLYTQGSQPFVFSEEVSREQGAEEEWSAESGGGPSGSLWRRAVSDVKYYRNDFPRSMDLTVCCCGTPTVPKSAESRMYDSPQTNRLGEEIDTRKEGRKGVDNLEPAADSAQASAAVHLPQPLSSSSTPTQSQSGSNFASSSSLSGFYYTLEFTYRFSHVPDTVYFAACYPYTYSHLQQTLRWIKNNVPASICTQQELCSTSAGYSCPLLTVTHNPKSDKSDPTLIPMLCTSSHVTDREDAHARLHPGGLLLADCIQHLDVSNIAPDKNIGHSNISKSVGSSASSTKLRAFPGREEQHSWTADRPVVFLSSRVHPGETNASWIMQGFLSFILSSSREAQYLRDRFVYKIVPMLNVDGVVFGTYRGDMNGVDLNRVWKAPSMAAHPTIYFSKLLLESYCTAGTSQVRLFCDFHGHSRKRNVFLYGNNLHSAFPVASSSTSEYRLVTKKSSKVYAGSKLSGSATSGTSANRRSTRVPVKQSHVKPAPKPEITDATVSSVDSAAVCSTNLCQSLWAKAGDSEAVGRLGDMLMGRCEWFSLVNCKYHDISHSKHKDGTARVVVCKEMCIPRSYTLECSLFGPSVGDGGNMKSKQGDDGEKSKLTDTKRTTGVNLSGEKDLTIDSGAESKVNGASDKPSKSWTSNATHAVVPKPHQDHFDTQQYIRIGQSFGLALFDLARSEMPRERQEPLPPQIRTNHIVMQSTTHSTTKCSEDGELESQGIKHAAVFKTGVQREVFENSVKASAMCVARIAAAPSGDNNSAYPTSFSLQSVTGNDTGTSKTSLASPSIRTCTSDYSTTGTGPMSKQHQSVFPQRDEVVPTIGDNATTTKRRDGSETLIDHSSCGSEIAAGFVDVACYVSGEVTGTVESTCHVCAPHPRPSDDGLNRVTCASSVCDTNAQGGTSVSMSTKGDSALFGSGVKSSNEPDHNEASADSESSHVFIRKCSRTHCHSPGSNSETTAESCSTLDAAGSDHPATINGFLGDTRDVKPSHRHKFSLVSSSNGDAAVPTSPVECNKETVEESQQYDIADRRPATAAENMEAVVIVPLTGDADSCGCNGTSDPFMAKSSELATDDAVSELTVAASSERESRLSGSRKTPHTTPMPGAGEKTKSIGGDAGVSITHARHSFCRGNRLNCIESSSGKNRISSCPSSVVKNNSCGGVRATPAVGQRDKSGTHQAKRSAKALKRKPERDKCLSKPESCAERQAGNSHIPGKSVSPGSSETLAGEGAGHHADVGIVM